MPSDSPAALLRGAVTTLIAASAALAAALLTGCASAPGASVTGTATYRERLALPPAAVFEAVLEDISLADAPAVALGRTRVDPAGQVPIRFAIAYDPAALQPNRRYAVRAQILVGTQLMFTTDTVAPVLGSTGVSNVELLMRRASTVAAPSSDAPQASLENTYWKLVSLRGKTVVVAERQSEPHFILQREPKRVAGSSGCNRLLGAYTLDGDKLSFGRTAGTMMMCTQGMQQERAFLDALAEVVRWRIDGQRLLLFDAGGRMIGEFESRYLQ